MSVLYTTVAKEAHAEQTIEKSRFISHIYRVESREDAEAIIASLRAQYRDASHNVPAMVIGDRMQLQWASDDGEPSGTSGAPMLQMLVKEGITNVLVVVTRYFGGIKLGPGGLVRAYTGSARMALEAAGRYDVRGVRVLELSIPYSLLDTLMFMESRLPFTSANVRYTDKVTLDLVYEPEHEDQILAELSNLIGGPVDTSSLRDEIR